MRHVVRGLVSFLIIACMLATSSVMLDGSERASSDRTPQLPPTIPPTVPERTVGMDDLLSTVGTSFLENRGQAGDPDVLFYVQGRDLSVGLTGSGLVVTVHESAPAVAGPDASQPLAPGRLLSFRIGFKGCNDVSPVGLGDAGFPTDIYRGKDPSLWVKGARSFSEVVYEDIYDRVDLRFHFKDGALKYDFTVLPGGDPSSIVLGYEGVDGLEVDPVTGDLLIGTAMGVIRDSRPVLVDQDGRPLPSASCHFKLMGGSSCGFDVAGGLDPARPLTIDPGLVRSTFLGGSGSETIECIEIDKWGNYYVAGITLSPDFPFTKGGYIPAYQDGFLVMMDASLSRILLSTYIVGSSNEGVLDIALVEDGIILCGATYSDDLPTPGSPISSVNHPGGFDGFIMKMAYNGTLLYGSYFGSRNYDDFREVVVSPDGSVCMLGWTNSTDLPCTDGAFCTTYRQLSREPVGFLMKMDSTLERILLCTYLNIVVESDVLSWVPNIAIDPSGNIFVTGTSNRFDLPYVEGAFSSVRKGHYDGFILKLDPMGTKALAATYLGGSRNESVNSILIAPDGYVYVSGETDSNNFPRVPATCSTIRSFDGFLACFDGSLSHLRFSYIFGGEAGGDYPKGLVMRADMAVVYIVGYTNSRLLPCTPGCIDPTNEGTAKLFIAGMDTSTGCCTYMSYLGVGGVYMGLYSDQVYGAIGNDLGEICIVGYTVSRDFPTTPGVWSRMHQGGVWDGFLMVIDPRPCQHPSPPTGLRAQAGERSVRLTWDTPTPEGAKVLRHCVYRGEDPGDLTWLCNVTTSDSYVDAAVVGGLTYHYSVSAFTSAGEGDRSEAVPARPVDRPSQPVNLTYSTENGSVTLRWSPPATDGGMPVQGYEVWRGESTQTIVHLDSTKAIWYTDRDVVIGRTYIYEVLAFNGVGGGEEGRVIVVPKASAPSAPRDLVLYPTDERVWVTWRAPLSDGGTSIVGYRVLRGTTPVIAEMRGRDLPARTYRYIDPEVTNGVTYYYCIVAVTDSFESPPSEIASAVPCTVPTRPLDLVAVAGDGQVTLMWKPPVDSKGKPILGYYVFSGQSPSGLSPLPMVGNTTYVDDELFNGVTYFYEVAAVNEMGQSLRSNPASATPMALPGRPVGLSARLVGQGVELSWYPPSEAGGSVALDFRIYRGTSEESLVQINEVINVYLYLDSTAGRGASYLYAVAAVNAMGEGPRAFLDYSTITAPDDIGVLTAVAGNGFINLTWLTPYSTGGTPIEAYFIFRGLSRDAMREINWTNGLAYTDTDVKNGQTYHYQVQAKNSLERGPMSEVASATPYGPSGAPLQLILSYEDGHAKLLWLPPAEDAGRAPPTGYIVRRGTSPGVMFPLADLGSITMFLDVGVEPGRTYYYTVIAKSAVGDGEPAQAVSLTVPVPEEPRSVGTMALVALAALIAVAVVAAAVVNGRRRARARGAAPAPKGGKVAPWAVGAGQGAAAAPAGPPTYIVEEAFVVYRDGRLMASCGREECRTPDADLMSGMLIAIQGIIQDGLVRGGELENIRYGENLVMMSSGPYVNLAVSVYGEPGAPLKNELDATVSRIEAAYAGVIEEWTGDLSAIAGIESLMMPLIRGTEGVTREVVKGTVARPEVSLLSALDFHQGYVRLKLAVVNTTLGLVADAAFGVEYDTEMLRLEHVEPEGLRLTGDRVVIGNVGAGERKTVALYFDPQICQGSHIDGFLTYVDAQGERHRVEMKRRTADIVCPIFFTREHANTAMLRRLVKDTLKMTDLKVFRYPAELGPEVVLTLGKAAMGGTDVQLVREYVVRGPPYNAEVWYYGQTKVHGYQIVIRLGVIEERGALEMFAASTAMEPVTGLLAELRRELDTVMGDRYRGEQRMDLERDEDLRRVLEDRELLLDLLFDEDGTPGAEATTG